jgi:hypothetical protein
LYEIYVLKLGEAVDKAMDKATRIGNSQELANFRRREVEVAIPRLFGTPSQSKGQIY